MEPLDMDSRDIPSRTIAWSPRVGKETWNPGPRPLFIILHPVVHPSIRHHARCIMHRTLVLDLGSAVVWNDKKDTL